MKNNDSFLNKSYKISYSIQTMGEWIPNRIDMLLANFSLNWKQFVVNRVVRASGCEESKLVTGLSRIHHQSQVKGYL